MILNLGLDPLVVALLVGVVTAPTVWGLDRALSLGQRQAANALLVAALAFLGWGLTSYPWITTLYVTMLAVAYGVNQALGHLITAITERNPHV